MANRRIPVLLDEFLYQRLAEQAEAEDREPAQQAKAIIRRALEATATEPRPAAGAS